MKQQDAFVALATAKAASVGSLPVAEIIEALFGRNSRFGTYGPPTNIKVTLAFLIAAWPCFVIAAQANLVPALLLSSCKLRPASAAFASKP